MSLIQSHEEQPILNLYYLVEVPKAGVMLDMLNRSLSAFWDSFQEVCKSNNICPHVHMYQYDTDCVEFFDSFEQKAIPPIMPSSASKTVLSPALELLHKEMMHQYSIPCKKVPHFYPIVILMSCSHIQDDFENQYHTLWSYYWYANATKIGFAIGDSADLDMLVDMTGTAEAVISSTNLELFRRLLRFRSLADEDCDIEVLLDDIASFESKYTPTKRPKACSRLCNAGSFFVTIVNDIPHEVMPGQEMIIMKGQVMPCASLEEYKRGAFTLSNDYGVCRVTNMSERTLEAYIILNPQDSFFMQEKDHVFPLDDIPISPFTVDSLWDIDSLFDSMDTITIRIPLHDNREYIGKIPLLDGQTDIKHSAIGHCDPQSPNDTIFCISPEEHGYRMTNVSTNTFAVIKEFKEGSIIDFESGGKIAMKEDQWYRGVNYIMDISVPKTPTGSDSIVVPSFDEEDWGDW